MRIAVAAVVTSICACGFSQELTPPRDAPSIDAAEVPACFAARCRKRTITIDPAKVVGGPHAAFPLLVQLTDPDFAMASGADFVFTAADGTTPLPHERERFAANELIAWVRVPMLAGATTLHLYYGDPAAADTQMPTAVWDADTQGVWHLAATAADSTAKANAGTGEGGVMLGVAGKIGNGARFDGLDDRIRVAGSSSLAAVATTGTVSLWVNWDSAVINTYQRLWMAANTFDNDGRGMEWATNAQGFYYYYPSFAGGENYVAITNPFTNGTWHHVALAQDFATKSVKLYVDGTLRANEFDNLAVQWTGTATQADWYWGGTPARARFAGMLDEIRVSTVVRSAEWIATEYANQSSPSTFYSVR